MYKGKAIYQLTFILLGLLVAACVPIGLEDQPERWALVIEDGRIPSLWEVSVAAGALDGSVEVYYDETTQKHSLKLNYHHSEAAGFNYIDYTRPVDLDLENKEIEMVVHTPQDPNAYLSFILYDLNDRHAIRDLEGNGHWQTIRLGNGDVQEVAVGFDWSRVKLIRFRSIGDAGQEATQGAYLVDSIIVLGSFQEK